MSESADCIFCKIVSGEIPGSVVLKQDDITAFRDINPQAPVHVLVIPNEHVTNTLDLRPEHDALVGRLTRAAVDVARQEGIDESGYRLVVNTGPDALNAVPHLHIHVVGGRKLGWPPG